LRLPQAASRRSHWHLFRWLDWTEQLTAPVPSDRSGPAAKVRTGHLVGNEHGGYLEFLGVPYAQAPVGAAAFLPPRPLPSSDDVRYCQRYGASANASTTPSAFVPEPVIDGDNVLNLNVWTPALGPARLPVFVWVHGGGFISGCNASPWYHGGAFARDGVVAVTINYRLGLEGFLRLDDANANRGLRDMIAALGWIQENIAALGGDPDRVTLGGQSAGGAACLALFTSGAARGLFRRTAVQSSGALLPMASDEATAMADHFATAAGVRLDPDGLASVPPGRRAELDHLYHPTGVARRPGWQGGDMTSDFGREILTLRPTVDGSLIAGDTFGRARAGLINAEALLIGTTAEELVGPVAAVAADMTGLEIADAIRSLGISETGLARYLELGTDRASLPWALGQAYTDWRYRIPGRVLADAAADSIDVFKYEFRFAARTPEPGAHRAQHSSDIPFVFDNLGAERVDASVGQDAPQELADRMHAAWVRFIAGRVGGDAEPWSRYHHRDPRTMIFEGGSRLRDTGQGLAEVWGDSAGSTVRTPLP
jgi:para-nitrobenzyl esterase